MRCLAVVTLTCTTIVLGTMPTSVAAAETIDSTNLLKVLCAVPQFDNVKLDYTISGGIKPQPFPIEKFPDVAKQYELKNHTTDIIPYRCAESLIVRGPNVTFIREAGPGADIQRRSIIPQSEQHEGMCAAWFEIEKVAYTCRFWRFILVDSRMHCSRASNGN